MCTAAGRGWLPRGYLREKPRPIRAHEHAARAGSAGCVAVRSRRAIVCGPGPGVCAGGAPVGAARRCRRLASARSTPAGHRRGASRCRPRPLGGRAAHDLSRSVSCPAACTTGARRTAAPANHGSAVAVRICLLDCALCRTRADRIGILRPGFGSACTAGGSLAGAGLALCCGTGRQRTHAALLGGHAAHRRPLPLDWDAAEITDGPLCWVARDSAKPGRQGPQVPQGPQTWVLHASARWSQDHIESDAESVARQLLQAFEALAGPLAGPLAGSLSGSLSESLPGGLRVTAHRWRYALPAPHLVNRCWWDAPAGLGLCGDWMCGAGVEGAWLSGRALARRALATLTR